MEKSDKKRILTRVLIVIAALTLLSCCFLGSTFAKYVTSAGGTAQIGVAKWDVSVTPSAALDVTVDANKLSPDMTAYDSSTHASNPRSHTSGKFLVATIVNNGDVAATITVSADDTATCVLVADHPSTEEGFEDKSTEAAACFSIKFYKSDTNDAAKATEGLVSETLDAKTTDSADAIYIFAEVTWTSQDTSGNGDALDTWIGQYVTSVSWDLSYTATQNSELPTTSAP